MPVAFKHPERRTDDKAHQKLILAQTTVNPKALYPKEVLMARFGVETSLFYKLIRQGKIPAPRKIGRLSRWLGSDIEAADAALLGR